MTPTHPRAMPHHCRKCGERFDHHMGVKLHAMEAHGIRLVAYCNTNCGFKATYHELQEGRALYGPGRDGPSCTGCDHLASVHDDQHGCRQAIRFSYPSTERECLCYFGVAMAHAGTFWEAMAIWDAEKKGMADDAL